MADNQTELDGEVIVLCCLPSWLARLIENAAVVVVVDGRVEEWGWLRMGCGSLI